VFKLFSSFEEMDVLKGWEFYFSGSRDCNVFIRSHGKKECTCKQLIKSFVCA